jgi:hypothetical protein
MFESNLSFWSAQLYEIKTSFIYAQSCVKLSNITKSIMNSDKCNIYFEFNSSQTLVSNTSAILNKVAIVG